MTSNLLEMPQRWATAWSSTDPELWVGLYSSDASYTDHAFRVSRSGHDLLRTHFELWRTANPDFTLTLNPAVDVWWRDVDHEKGHAQCSFRTINVGTFKNDLPTKKASGREFEFSAVVDLKIENGLIAKVDEWYTIEFDESVPVSGYR